MQVIIDEIVSHVRTIDGASLSAEAMRLIVQACVRAVQDALAHDGRTKDERSFQGTQDEPSGREE